MRAEDLLASGGERGYLQRQWLKQGSSGAVALQDGEMVGYVLGVRAESPIFGRSVWIDRAGHSAAKPEVIRDLYASAATQWVEEGFVRHYVYVPALPEFLEPWYRLGFAQMHLEATRETGGGQVHIPEGVTVRRGSAADIGAVAIPLNDLIAEIQSEAPSFSSVPPEPIEVQRADWLETFEDPSTAYFVMEREGAPIGHSLLYAPEATLGVPVDALYLASTAIVPRERGAGIGAALAGHVLEWAHAQGYGSLVTNWRVSNLTASRFWPAAGWRPTFLRLQRVVGVN